MNRSDAEAEKRPNDARAGVRDRRRIIASIALSIAEVTLSIDKLTRLYPLQSARS
jgi:hypothetical protein